jgi:hypothetical protein
VSFWLSKVERPLYKRGSLQFPCCNNFCGWLFAKCAAAVMSVTPDVCQLGPEVRDLSNAMQIASYGKAVPPAGYDQREIFRGWLQS